MKSWPCLFPELSGRSQGRLLAKPAAGLALLFLLLFHSPVASALPFRAGDIVGTNFGLVNRFAWTNDNGQVYTPSNTPIRLHDFEGKIVFYVFFDVW